ncbi:signal peptidase II [Microbacterium rhizophilus]|uniref:signal peptidase II n=1 Tax=Microbacterium rhizophilus TaxID=3138934 RepID=UPI0031EC9C44
MTDRAPLRTAAASTTIAILAILVLAADQFAKHLVLTSLPPETPVPVLGEALQWYLILNAGAAFSIGEGVTWVFTIALALVACGIVWLALTRVRSRVWAVVLGLLLGGVLGNLTDRLFREPGFAVGHVVDFISTPWMMPAIYNVADVFIVCSMITIAALTLFGLALDGSGRKTAAEAAAEQVADEAAAADSPREP